MEHTGNVDRLDDAFIWKDNAGLTSLELGRSAGSQRLYANVDIIPPGAYSTKYHSHTRQEEFFYILSGEGTLRTNEGEKLLGRMFPSGCV
ncbi:MAG TPA: cupin domain-containing protein, partial [Candidatus Limiplasma sp.]|nr:cupin domain-containing protein [Candidatus Limiplasma sp.]